MYSEYFSCCFPDRGKKGSMGHFKEIEIVFINIFFPNRVETRSKNSRKINKVYEISATVPLSTKCGMSQGTLYPQVAIGLYVLTGWDPGISGVSGRFAWHY